MAVDTAQITRVLRGASPDAKASFAFALGAKPEQSVLVVDNKKEPTVLLSAAKKEGGNKACCGKLSSKGSDVTFETDSPLSSFTKHLNDFFKHNKLSFKASVIGEQTDDDGDDDSDDAVDGPAMFQPDFVGKMLQKARRRPMNFGFAMGRSPEDSALGVHPRKNADTLFRLARKEGGSSRGGYGNVVAEGKLVQFHCEEDPAPGMRRAIRGLFKAWGVKNKVQVFGPAGEFEAEDVDEDDIDAAATAAPGPTAATAPIPAAGDSAITMLRDELRALLPELRNAAGGDGRVALQVAYRECEAALAAGNAPTAAAQLRTIRDLLARQSQGTAAGATASPAGAPTPSATAQAADDPAIAGVREELKALMPELRNAAGGEDRAVIQVAYRDCEAAIAAGNGPSAVAQLRTLQELLARQSGAASPAATVASAAEVPATATPASGDATIAGVRDELRALLPELRSAAGGEGRVALQVAYRECETAIADGNAPTAASQLRTLRDLLARQAPAAATGVAQLQAELEGLMPALKVAAKLPDRAGPVRDTWKEADTALKAGQVPAAEAAMARLRELAQLPAAGVAAAKAGWPDVRSRWQEASETVDGQVRALQAALRSNSDADLAEIADRGLRGLTGNFRTPMMAAVMELDQAANEAFQAAAVRALQRIAQFEAHIVSDKRIEAVDDNPFGVTVTIKDTLGTALGDMRRVLTQAVG